jgi:hypothetical protein
MARQASARSRRARTRRRRTGWTIAPHSGAAHRPRRRHGGLLGPARTPGAEASGFDQAQRDNAALIIAAGRDLGLSVRDQTIAVMTAMGESSLQNLDYGDWETSGVANPDGSRTTSIGLFQQQDGWGNRDERLDPYTAATLFYRAMIARVPDREALPPTTVAHRTQVNRDPEHFAPYWPLAEALVADLTR